MRSPSRGLTKRHIRTLLFVGLSASLSATAFAQDHVHPAIGGGSGLPHGIPDFCANYTIRSATNGAWSNPGTWNPARVPVAGDKVSISHAVTYDALSSQALNCIEVRGQFTFREDINTRLIVGTVMVYPNGSMQIGTPTSTISSAVTAEIVIADQPLDTAFDPEQFGTGIIGLGKMTIAGAPHTGFARLTMEPAAGASTLSTVDTLTGWQPGEKVFIPDTRHLTDAQRTSYTPQWEERTVGSVTSTSVTVTTGLTFAHEGARDMNGTVTFLPHVANLSRNVIIRSANPAGTRGHILFSMRAEVDIRHALLKDLGRTQLIPLDSTTFDASGNVTHIGTNQIGRYPLHMHHVMGPTALPSYGYQYRLVGNAIDGGRKWGITIHNTHYGLVRGNVVYNVEGSGIVTEDGSESRNIIERNFIGRVTGPGGRGDERGMGDLAWEGSGIFLRGPNNAIRDNVVADVLHDYGYKFFSYLMLATVNIPKFPGADPAVAGQFTPIFATALPILEFARNEVYGASLGGMTYWWIGTKENDPEPGAQISWIEDLRIWHVWESGIYNYASNLVAIARLVVRGKGPAQSFTIGFKTQDYQARNLLITNADIQGMTYGVIPSTTATGGVQVIRNSYLRNNVNISIQTMWTSNSEARTIVPRKVVIRNVRLDMPPGSLPLSYRAVEFAYNASPIRHMVQRDDVFLYEFNGNASANFKGFFAEQRPDFIVPVTTVSQYNTHYIEGAPVAGLTNQQTWATYGLAIAGAIAPCAATLPSNDGFACAIAWTADDGLPSMGPSPSHNVSITR